MPGVVLDACCLINLHAAGKMDSIVSDLAYDFFVVRIVLNEALFIRRAPAAAESEPTLERVDLSTAIDSGLLQLCDLSDTENESFVEFAQNVDDGEAQCLAVAKHRGMTFATDDRKATRIATRAAVSVITTPEIIHDWANETERSEDEVAGIVRNIQAYGNFIPRTGSSKYAWWVRMAERNLP